ncbi:hypothetical protein Poly30_19080 [Planctomycetes bacterium Poly30]|uniref:Uncharacterized protein n=1 Tax=Saltatorellus ferox TaxID=2528018 RepID=A0A518EQN5_9BACT|nr:hypothetical protein Poly30_19080 [Planctomycetes bacterium Poly30]
MAFLVGAALAIAAAAPQLLSGWGGRLIERAIEARVDADVEVYDLELHWKRPQRARRITLMTRPDESGQQEKVAEFALRFPSLLELLDSASTEWEFKVTDAEITARVDADGTSDLGRCLGIDAGDGRSELGVLLSALGRGLDEEGDEDQRSIQTTIQVRRARFVDMASEATIGAGSGRLEATVSDLVIQATKSRVGYQVKLKDARVEYGRSREALVSFALNFGGPVGDAHGLRSASVEAQPIPLATLRLLGLVPRGAAVGSAGNGSSDGADRGFTSRDTYGSMASTLLAAAALYFENGASVDFRYGMLPLMDPTGPVAEDGGAEGARFSLKLDGDLGRVAVLGRRRGDQLIAEPAVGEDNAIEASLRLPSARLSRFMGSLVPPDTIVFEDVRDEADWSVRSRSFQLPLAAQALTVERLFGSVRSSERQGTDGPTGRRQARAASLARAVAGVLRRTDADLSLTSTEPSGAALTLWPAGVTERRAEDRLQWTHWWTSVVLTGELGATVQSRWRVEPPAGTAPSRQFARLSLSIPGSALTPGEDLSPRLDLTLPQIPLALVQKLAPLPADLAVLLPARFDRLVLEGIGMPRFLAGPARGAGSGRGFSSPIVVRALLDGSDRIEGVYESGTMTIPRASVSVPLDDLFCERILRAYMPWFEEIHASEGGGGGRSLDIEMRDFVFTMGEEEFEQEGEVELRPGPLRVKLHPSIASELCASDTELRSQGEGGALNGIRWTPGPMRLSLKGLSVYYDRVELPISDDYVTTLEGSLYRENGSYSLSGMVETDFIMGHSEGDAVRAVAINRSSATSGGAVRVTFSQGTIDPNIAELVRKAAEIGEKVK